VRAARGLALLVLVSIQPVRAEELAPSEADPSMAPPHEIRLSPGDDLRRALTDLPDGTLVHLGPGEYELGPLPYVEPTCGNCEDAATEVVASVGLVIAGKGVRIAGAGADETVLHTGAGYGLLFEGCTACALSGVTITGGVRDRDGNATDAAIVAKHSTVEIAECLLRDNIGDEAVVAELVVGIMGIAGREGSDLWIHDNRIVRNSWDGIALYRDAAAAIENNVIDGVDRARGSAVGGGRGAGIGLTWNSRAFVRGNLVENYWKGIGLFVDAHGELEANVVENILTWGISIWDGEKGKPSGWIRHNAVYDTGACGVAVILGADAPGMLSENAIVRTGQDSRYDSGEPYCKQIAIAEYATPEVFEIGDNLLFENREPGGAGGSRDLEEPEFTKGLGKILPGLSMWPALAEADFLARFGSASAER